MPVVVESFGNVRQMDDFTSYLPVFLLTLGHTWALSQTGEWPITQAGAVGLGAYADAHVTNTPIFAFFDDFQVTGVSTP